MTQGRASTRSTDPAARCAATLMYVLALLFVVPTPAAAQPALPPPDVELELQQTADVLKPLHARHHYRLTDQTNAPLTDLSPVHHPSANRLHAHDNRTDRAAEHRFTAFAPGSTQGAHRVRTHTYTQLNQLGETQTWYPTTEDAEQALAGLPALPEIGPPAHAERLTWSRYDRAGRLTRTEERGRGAHVPGGPARGTIVSQWERNGLGHVVRYTQEGQGRFLAETFGEHRFESGEPGRVETAQGTWRRRWDSVGRPTLMELELPEDASPTPGFVERTWDWSEMDTERRWSITEVQRVGDELLSDVTTYQLDERGRTAHQVEMRALLGGGTRSYERSYAWNHRDQRIGLSTSWQEQAPIATQWGFDSRGRLETLTLPEGTSTFEWTPDDLPLRVTRPDGSKTEWDHDARGLVSSIEHTRGEELLARVELLWDERRNRVAEHRVLPALDPPERYRTYAYTSMNQLQETATWFEAPAEGIGWTPEGRPRMPEGPAAQVETLEWSGYDRVQRGRGANCPPPSLGQCDVPSTCPRPPPPTCPPLPDEPENEPESPLNAWWRGTSSTLGGLGEPLRVEAAPGEPLEVRTWTAAGQLESIRRAITPEESAAWGQPPSYGVLERWHRWDALGRLIEVQDRLLGPPELPAHPLRTLRYTYDHSDLRTRILVCDGNGAGQPTHEEFHFYEGLVLLEVRNAHTGALIERNHPEGLQIHATTRVGATGLEHEYLLRDALNSTLAVSSTHSPTAAWDLSLHGEILAASHPDHPQRNLFTGHRWDVETSTHYMRARHYDPALGRFLSPDSWLGEPHNPMSLHRTLYAYGNPGSWWDPDGRHPVVDQMMLRACLANASNASERASCAMFANRRRVQELSTQWRNDCERDQLGHDTVADCVASMRQRLHDDYWLAAFAYGERTRASRQQEAPSSSMPTRSGSIEMLIEHRFCTDSSVFDRALPVQ